MNNYIEWWYLANYSIYGHIFFVALMFAWEFRWQNPAYLSTHIYFILWLIELNVFLPNWMNQGHGSESRENLKIIEWYSSYIYSYFTNCMYLCWIFFEIFIWIFNTDTLACSESREMKACGVKWHMDVTLKKSAKEN